jgi:hypothetical protein
MIIVVIIAAWFAASVLTGLLVGQCLHRAQCQEIESRNHMRVLRARLRTALEPGISTRGSARWPTTKVTSWKS